MSRGKWLVIALFALAACRQKMAVQPRYDPLEPSDFFDVMTSGFGAMPSYAPQVPVQDRWAIVAYIRALQLSQHATLDDVPVDQRQALEGQP